MVKLKKRIITKESLPEEKKIIPITTIIISILIILIIGVIFTFSIIKLLPYINAVDINKITGKKIHITECNTRDYIIISADKTYSISITNNLCETKKFEGDITIKNNEIIFNDNIKGYIDNNYNIIINNNIFESDKK